MKIKIRPDDPSMVQKHGLTQMGHRLAELGADSRTEPPGHGHAETNSADDPWSEVLAQADALAEARARAQAEARARPGPMPLPRPAPGRRPMPERRPMPRPEPRPTPALRPVPERRPTKLLAAGLRCGL